jgi:tetratricopeptide (TPR) repeat protein
VSYRLLADLLVKTNGGFGAESELDKCLTEAEERGLVGWERHRNTYDMHPIIRSVVWGLRRAEDAERISGYFEATPLAQRSVVTSVDDLQPALQLYALFVARGLVEEAFEIYARRLRPSLTRLVAGSTSIAVLREFTNHDGGVRADIRNPSHRVTVLRDLAHAHMVSGSPLPAQQLLLHAVEEGLLRRDLGAVSIGLRNLAIACFVVGDFEAAFRAFERGRSITKSLRAKSQPSWTSWHDAESAIWEGLVLGAVGRYEDAQTSMDAGVVLAMDAGSGSLEVIVDCFRARVELWCAAPTRAMERVLNARLAAEALGRERDMIHADVIAAAAAIDIADLDAAHVHVERAVERATSVNYVSGELPARVQQGRLQRLERKWANARQTISEVIARSEASGYRLELIDAYNVLATVAVDEGNIEEAAGCARRALELAECDGAGLRYEPGAARATQYLSELGEPGIAPRAQRGSGSQAILARLERLAW